MSIVVAIGVVLLALLALSRKDAFIVKTVLLVIELCLICTTALALNRKDDLFLQIPGTSIENAAVVEVVNSGTMYLDSSQSVYMDNKFYLTDGSYSEMTEWMEDTQKNIYLYVVSGQKIMYKKNLGLYQSGMESSVWSIYKSWSDTGVVPTDNVRYWLLFLYLEV